MMCVDLFGIIELAINVLVKVGIKLKLCEFRNYCNGLHKLYCELRE